MDRATLLRRAAALLIAPSALAQLTPEVAAASAPALSTIAAGGGYLTITNVGSRLWPELLENFYELARRMGHDTLYIEGHGWRMLPEHAELDAHSRHLALVS